MGKTSNASKQKWIKANYTQVKIAVPHEIASTFKERCQTAGVSMAKELSNFMVSDQSIKTMPDKGTSVSIITRPQRKKALKILNQQLEEILDAEKGYMCRIPKNLQKSSRYNVAEETVNTLKKALGLLSEAY